MADKKPRPPKIIGTIKTPDTIFGPGVRKTLYEEEKPKPTLLDYICAGLLLLTLIIAAGVGIALKFGG